MMVQNMEKLLKLLTMAEEREMKLLPMISSEIGKEKMEEKGAFI